MLMPEVSRYMTREPYTVPSTTSAAAAREIMEIHQIRHLPILDGTRLVGLLSKPDLDALARASPSQLFKIPVTRVMTEPVSVWGATPLDEVSAKMAETHAECVVVLGGHGVQGIFTANDAFRALSEVLARVVA